jgi:hypothetical protein
MSVLAACVIGAVDSSEPPLQASKPAPAAIETIVNLMSSSFECKVEGGANVRFERTIRGSISLSS